jgi:RNA polymerase sigma-70 factor (ECF subfamily)
VSTDDTALFSAWNEGDRAAGQRLVERHYDSIVRFFRTKAGADCDDLVQRTFLAWAKAKTRFRGESSVRSFLFGIARNVLFEHIRARTKGRRVDPDFSVHSLHNLDPGASTIAEQRAEQRVLIAAMQRIPLDIQVALELYYWEGMSVAELAEVQEIPPGTVKSRLHRGRTLLREAMESLPAQPDERASVRALIDDWASGVRRHARVDVDAHSG